MVDYYNKAAKYKAFIPSQDEIDIVLAYIMDKKSYPQNSKGIYQRYRDYVLFHLYFYGGLRPAEALNLRWKDIDFTKRLARILPYFNKQKDETSAQLNSICCKVLKCYKSMMEDLGILFEFLFPSLESFEPLSTARFSDIYRKIMSESGIDSKAVLYTENGQPRYKYNQYSGRKWFGTQVWKKTKSEVAVQHLLRHRTRLASTPYILPSTEDVRQISDSIFEETPV